MGELLHAAGTLGFDFDIADSRAFFTAIDPDDAAPNSPGGKRVPEAVGLVVSSGVTMHDYKRFSASLRLRAFGPRDLTSDGFIAQMRRFCSMRRSRYRITKKWSFVVEALNLLNRKDHDIDYAYTSRITPTPTAELRHSQTFGAEARQCRPPRRTVSGAT
jgi:hypothetical protein